MGIYGINGGVDFHKTVTIFGFTLPRRIMALVGCFIVMFPMTLLAQSSSGATVDGRGVTIRFSTSAAGRVVKAFAVNIGAIDSISIGPDGVARLDLSRVPLPRDGRACFFLVSQSDGDIIGLSNLKGFYNPFWEQQKSGPSDEASRTPEQAREDLADFERAAAAANAYRDRENGKRLRGGQCRSVAVSETPRPPFAFEGVSARRYGAVRCADAIGAPVLSCAAIRSRLGLEDDPAFTEGVCDARLQDVKLANKSPRGRPIADEHRTIAAAAAAAATANLTNRPAIARQCIVDVATRSSQLLEQWRQDRDTTDGRERAALNEGKSAVVMLTDENDQRAELTRQLQLADAAKARAATASKRPPRTSTRDYPCPIK